MDWDSVVAQRARHMAPSLVAGLARAASKHPDMISFAQGVPDPGLYPVEELQAAISNVLIEQHVESLNYSLPVGIEPLRTLIAERLSERGVPTLTENVVITSGASQGIFLVSQILLEPGDVVLVENPTFAGALEIFAGFQARCVGIPTDAEGIQVDSLARELAQGRGQLIYCMPGLHNPLGVDLALERRHRLLELASEFGVPTLIDDPYGELRYHGESPVPIRRLDENGCAIRLGSFSKTIGPGIRVGWMEAPIAIAGKLILAKKDADRATNSLMQRAIVRMMQDGTYDRHVRRLRQGYGQKLELLLAALRDSLPNGVKWTEPSGGFFLWLTLPEQIDTSLLFEACIERGVLFSPGIHYFAENGARNHLRLSFAVTPAQRIPEGIQRLAAAIREALEPAAS